MNLTDMIGAAAHQASGGREFGKCTDVLVNTHNGEVAGLLMDVKWGFSTRSVLVSRQRIGWDAGHWTIALSDEELEERIDTGENEEEGGLPDLPVLVVGPFGYTVAPMMAGAVLKTFRNNGHNITPTPEAMEGFEGHWFDTLRGLPMFDTSGQLGELTDIVVNPETLTGKSLIATEADGGRATYGFDKMRHVAQDDSSIIMELSADPDYVPTPHDGI